MTTLHDRRTQPYQSLRITDYAQTLLDKNYQQSRRYHIKSADNGLAQVFVHDRTSHIVNLGKRSYTCGEFQEYCLPCRHAIAVYLHQTHNPCNYVDEYYSINYYRITYSMSIQPVREEDLVEKNSDCEAPVLAKQQGHPKKQRFRHDENGSRVVTCSYCKEKGHNRHSCRNAL